MKRKSYLRPVSNDFKEIFSPLKENNENFNTSGPIQTCLIFFVVVQFSFLLSYFLFSISNLKESTKLVIVNHTHSKIKLWKKFKNTMTLVITFSHWSTLFTYFTDCLNVGIRSPPVIFRHDRSEQTFQTNKDPIINTLFRAVTCPEADIGYPLPKTFRHIVGTLNSALFCVCALFGFGCFFLKIFCTIFFIIRQSHDS